jgi:hypothetical protein
MYRVTIPLLIALLWPQLFTLIYLITITYVCYLRYFLILLFYIAENNNKIMWNFICFIIDDNYLILHDNYLILHELCSVSRYCFKRISYNIKSFELILTWLKLPCLFDDLVIVNINFVVSRYFIVFIDVIFFQRNPLSVIVSFVHHDGSFILMFCQMIIKSLLMPQGTHYKKHFTHW